MEFLYLEIKPGFQKLKDRIIKIFTDNEFELIATKTFQRTTEFNKIFYKRIVDKPYFPHINKYLNGEAYHPFNDEIMNGPSISIIFAGNEGAINKARELVGDSTNPNVGTIRFDYSIKDEYGKACPNITQNVVYCSDSIENAEREISLVFVNCEKYGATSASTEINNQYEYNRIMNKLVTKGEVEE